MKIFGTMNLENNNLYIGGVNTLDLVKEYGTPLYVMDEKLIRENCRKFMNSFSGLLGRNKVVYAGKAFLTIAMAQLINEEGLNLDVVSGGELYTAYRSGFPMEKIYFHGNNKTNQEIRMGLSYGVGTFVVDNMDELCEINKTAHALKKVQNILLRVTPGVEAHTHEYIKTGQIDSKFGFTLLENNLFDVLDALKDMPNIHLRGLHCHIGSQIFNTEGHKEAIKVMIRLVKSIRDAKGIEVEELNLGGGFGIYYSEGDTPMTIEDYCEEMISETESICRELEVKVPSLVIEPGRAIVGNAGTTLYTVGGVKEIPNVRSYVSVDGGMTDNIRPSLYSASYECLIANKAEETCVNNVTIAGKCCESGDVLINHINIPQVEIGDIIAIMSTGAYCYSMSSNYNKIPKPPVVLVNNGESKVICRRETYEDIIRNELGLQAI